MAAAIVGVEFGRPAFKCFWEKYVGSEQSMRDSIEKLRKSPNIHLPTLEYGQYQPALVPLADWAHLDSALWAKNVGNARLSLTQQENDDPLSKDEPHVVPLTRCALLDAAIRKCFNSEPPIPINSSVSHQAKDSPNAKVHSIELEWTYEANGKPIKLKYTMICPWREPKPNEI